MAAIAQCSGTVLMVRPAAFGFNAEAARSNAFAIADNGGGTEVAALGEFDALADALDEAGIHVLTLDDTADPHKPDAVFPNNWVSFHADGTMILFPMATAPRRPERRAAEVVDLLRANGMKVRRTVDLSALEEQDNFLEGTGSLILDRSGARAFAALGPRTGVEAIEAYREATGDEIIAFRCADRSGRPIYHTNVLLSLGERFAIVCSEAIVTDDRQRVLAAIEEGGPAIIDTDFGQMERFACNLIQLRGAK
ncbi:MAG: arginine deiminase-related protein, partial [Sphingomicrobium sp.]